MYVIYWYRAFDLFINTWFHLFPPHLPTPLGIYFQRYLDQASSSLSTASDMRSILEEVQLEILKNHVLKLYIEDFYGFVEQLGGETALVMGELLKMRADRIAINITLNSFGTPLNDLAMRETGRILRMGYG